MPDRTKVSDFALALGAVDRLLASYAIKKGDAEGRPKWRTQSEAEHLRHAIAHAIDAYTRTYGGTAGTEEDLVSVATRVLMALQLALEQRARPQPSH